MNTTTRDIFTSRNYIIETTSGADLEEATYSVPWGHVVGYFVLSVSIVLGNTMVLVAVAKFNHLQTIPNMFVAGVAVMDMFFSTTGFLKTIDLIFPDLITGLLPCVFRLGLGAISGMTNATMLVGECQ